MLYNFDEVINRNNTNCEKYDGRDEYFGTKDVLPLWVADMDFQTPDFIINSLRTRLDHPILGYMTHSEEFSKVMASWVLKRHNWNVDTKDIKLVPGVVPGLNLAVLAFSQPGDSIIVQPPVYPPFFGAAKNNARKLVFNPLKLINGRYCFDFKNLEESIDGSTKMLLLCNPHNPGGSAWRMEELKQLVDICDKHNILIISDEIHSDIIFSGNCHIPLASISEKAKRITITLMSPSKTFNIAGLATAAAIITDEKLMTHYKRALNSVRVGMGNIFGIEAFISAYTYGEEWLELMLSYLESNINYVCEFVTANLKGIKPIKPESTYLVWLDCRDLGMNNETLRKFFIETCKVGLNNGADFGPGGEGFHRLNAGCPKSTLEEALNRIKIGLDSL